jgi:nucleoside-diphosphate-sugar epimerase
LSILNGAKVLATGIQGFTGYYIRDALERAGAQVFGIVESNPKEGEYVADLGDKAALAASCRDVQPDCLLHLAAIANVAHEDLAAFYRVNVIGTMNLLDAMVSMGKPCKKVVLASSANIYGNPPVSPVAEDTSPAPLNHYAMSKLAMEYLARNYMDRLPIVFARPFNYTGPGQTEHFLIPKIVGHFKRQESVINLGNLDVEREFNDVRLVAAAYVGILEGAQSGEAVNICTGKGYTMTQVLDMTRKLSGWDIEVRVDSRLVRPNELKRLVGSPDKLRRIVPNLPQYDLAETLRWMLEA